MCSEHMWLLSVWETTGRENLVLAAGAVQLSGTLLQGLIITEEQVAQVQSEGGAAVVSKRAASFAGLGAEYDNVMRLR